MPKPTTVYDKMNCDDSYKDEAAQSIEITIAQKSITKADTELGDSLTYIGNQQTQT